LDVLEFAWVHYFLLLTKSVRRFHDDFVKSPNNLESAGKQCCDDSGLLYIFIYYRLRFQLENHINWNLFYMLYYK
jgi:hypothetical protein